MLLPNKIADLHAPLLAIVIIDLLLEVLLELKLLSYKVGSVAFLNAEPFGANTQIADML